MREAKDCVAPKEAITVTRVGSCHERKEACLSSYVTILIYLSTLTFVVCRRVSIVQKEAQFTTQIGLLKYQSNKSNMYY
jgi:hypothetical protein